MLSPAANSTSKSSTASRARWAVRLSRCISIRDSTLFQSARCSKPSGSKSPPNSPVQPDKQIPIELRRHSRRIVISGKQGLLVLREVNTQQQSVARFESGPNPVQKALRLMRLEVADARPDIEHQPPLTCAGRLQFQTLRVVHVLRRHRYPGNLLLDPPLGRFERGG